MSNGSQQDGEDRKPPATAASTAMTTDRNECIMIREPSHGDIVLGRGSAQAWRPGNARFHELLDSVTPRYQGAKTKKAKRIIIHEIYSLLKATGRFLERSETRDGYIEIDESEAKEKIGYAIRYRKKRNLKAKAELVRQLGEETGAATVAIAPNPAKAPASFAAFHERHAAVSPSVPKRQRSASDEIEIIAEEDLKSVLDDLPTDTKHPS